MTALHAVRDGKGGTHIDASMFGASLAVGALRSSEYFGSGRDPVSMGSAHPRNAPYQAFRAKDGYFAMAAGNNALYRAACDAIARPDLVSDARFSLTALRAANQRALLEILEKEFASFTAEELLRPSSRCRRSLRADQ